MDPETKREVSGRLLQCRTGHKFSGDFYVTAIISKTTSLRPSPSLPARHTRRVRGNGAPSNFLEKSDAYAGTGLSLRPKTNHGGHSPGGYLERGHCRQSSCWNTRSFLSSTFPPSTHSRDIFLCYGHRWPHDTFHPPIFSTRQTLQTPFNKFFTDTSLTLDHRE